MPGLVPGILPRCHCPAQACYTACINSKTSDSRNSFAGHQPLHGFARVTATSRDGLVRHAPVMNDEIARQQGVTQIT